MSRDLRSYARQTQWRLLVGFFVLLFLVGDGLIFLIYGREAAMLGLVCLLVGLAPLLLIWAALTALEWLAGKMDRPPGSSRRDG